MMGLKDYHNLLERYSEFQKQCYDKNRVLAPAFNPLDLFNLEFDELTHSKILAWLFDPHETHNQGDLFFKCFLSYFDFNVDYNRWGYKVKREYSGNESIIDILVYGRDFIVYIENKTLSPEGYDQTDREYRDLIKLSRALNIKNNIVPIFLSPRGAKPKNKNWIPVSYHELAQAFENALSKIQSDYIRLFVKSWISVLKSMEA